MYRYIYLWVYRFSAINTCAKLDSANTFTKHNIFSNSTGETPTNLDVLNKNLTKGYMNYSTISSLSFSANDGLVAQVYGLRSTPQGVGTTYAILASLNKDATNVDNGAQFQVIHQDNGTMYCTAPYRTSSLTVNDVITKGNLEGSDHTFTGINTVPTPTSSSANGQVANKEYVDGKMTVTQINSNSKLVNALTNMTSKDFIRLTNATDGTNTIYAVEINARQVLTPPLTGRQYFQCNGVIEIGSKFYNLYQMDITISSGALVFYYLSGTSAVNVTIASMTSVGDGIWVHYT